MLGGVLVTYPLPDNTKPLTPTVLVIGPEMVDEGSTQLSK